MSLARIIYSTYGPIVYADDKYIVCRSHGTRYALLDQRTARLLHVWYTDTPIFGLDIITEYARQYIDTVVPTLDLV